MRACKKFHLPKHGIPLFQSCRDGFRGKLQSLCEEGNAKFLWYRKKREMQRPIYSGSNPWLWSMNNRNINDLNSRTESAVFNSIRLSFFQREWHCINLRTGVSSVIRRGGELPVIDEVLSQGGLYAHTPQSCQLDGLNGPLNVSERSRWGLAVGADSWHSISSHRASSRMRLRVSLQETWNLKFTDPSWVPDKRTIQQKRHSTPYWRRRTKRSKRRAWERNTL